VSDIKATIEAIADLLKQLETNLGVDPGFVVRLQFEETSDWAFVIQLQVALEAALTHVIVKTLGNEAVFEHVSRASFMGRTGKVELARSLGIIDATGVAICDILASIRNGFAHRLEHAGSTLKAYSAQLSGDRKFEIVKKLSAVNETELIWEREKGCPDFDDLLRSRLWLAAASVMCTLGTAEMTAQIQALERKVWKQAYDRETAAAPPLGLEHVIGGLVRNHMMKLSDMLPKKSEAGQL